jgi:hypothetical protein
MCELDRLSQPLLTASNLLNKGGSSGIGMVDRSKPIVIVNLLIFVHMEVWI